jgi:hypothetical protein
MITESSTPTLGGSVLAFARRARPVAQLASEYAASQLAGRTLAAVASILLVRLLPVREYAFYTVLLAGFTFISTSSDLGATESLSYFRRRAILKRKSWAVFYQAVLRFRRIVYLVGLLLSSGYVFYTARRMGHDVDALPVAVVMMGAAAWLAIEANTTAYALKLELRFREAYAVELSNESAKLLAVACLWVLSIATATAGMASIATGGLVAATLASRFWRRASQLGSASSRHVGRRIMRALLGQVAPVLPGTIHYALQAPLVALLAATYASAGNVAEVGALGRLGALVGVFSGFTSSVFVPRLANVSDSRAFMRGCVRWSIVMMAFSGGIILAVGTFADGLLWMLGRPYAGLRGELLIAAVAAIAATWGGFAWNINRARGWVRAQPWRVPVVGTGQLALFFLLDLSSTRGVLLFGVGTLLIDLVFQVSLSVRGFLSEWNA